MSVPTQACTFSGFKIYPGHGRTNIRRDGKTLHFITAKTFGTYKQNSKPHNIRWTVFYRRKHNKTKIKSESRNKSRKTTKFTRPILGMGLAEILAKTQKKAQIKEAANAKAAKY
ncbi:60S ribosomal protein L24-like [Octopus sinensis]|uniref:Large ribosomal subunit protein eL24 n=1 Tax=Octopus sinensis TaxID=2607531 RepID=A0A7E6EI14_9MOLL|nr:60S ribosomal protein L24-like [Octopus sinensis]